MHSSSISMNYCYCGLLFALGFVCIDDGLPERNIRPKRKKRKCAALHCLPSQGETILKIKMYFANSAHSNEYTF